MLLAAAALMVASCQDKLDEVPDNRTEIDSPTKVASLLTSAYPISTPAVMLELSGDNLVDDNVVVPATHNAPYEDFHAEAYKWLDIENYSQNADDTPYATWEAYYVGISTVNHAIAGMKEMYPGIETMSASEIAANCSDVAASWGEAHVLRAYLHFVLVSVFAEAYKNESMSEGDVGIPYVTEPETTVHVDYSTSEHLHSVKGTYDLIEKDLLAGLPLISDNYKVPAYHFNKNAANAFAARFYLFKRDYQKALMYANNALGGNPASVLRKWASINDNTAYTKRDSYWDEKASCNFLIQSTYSLQWRMLATARFNVNTGTTFSKDGVTYTVPSTLDATLWGSGPCWSGSMPCYSSRVYVSGEQQFGCYLFKLIEYFEYTDKIAGIGYVHMLYNPFSADETLLVRAEAKLYMGDRAGAIEDLNYWTTSSMCTQALTLYRIQRIYNRATRNNIYVSALHPAEMGFEKVLTGDDLSVLDCILHFRRIETIHNGDRWYDIKRYGITVTHFYRDAHEDEIHIDSLTYNDKRRVLQLPKNVIDAGYPPNRATGGGSAGGYSTGAGNARALNSKATIQPVVLSN